MDFYDTIEEAVAALRKHGSVHKSHIHIRVERECAKLLHDRSLPRDAIEHLAASSVRYADINRRSSLEINARGIVSLVTWLQHDSKLLASLASQVQRTVDLIHVTEKLSYVLSCFCSRR